MQIKRKHLKLEAKLLKREKLVYSWTPSNGNRGNQEEGGFLQTVLSEVSNIFYCTMVTVMQK